MQSLLTVRLTDNVLEDKDWPVRKVWIDREKKEVVKVEDVPFEAGATPMLTMSKPSVGMTLEELLAWLAVDNTGQHPEVTHHVKVEGDHRFSWINTAEDLNDMLTDAELPMGDAYRFGCRGNGLDMVPGCFVCGYESLSLMDMALAQAAASQRGAQPAKQAMRRPNVLMNNIAAFVESKEAGEDIVRMFGKGARLDYRVYEPNRIQLKFGVCDLHLPALNAVRDLVDAARDPETKHARLTKEIIEKARQAPLTEHLVIKKEDHDKVRKLYGEYYNALSISRRELRANARDQLVEAIALHRQFWEAVRWATDIYKLKDLGDWWDWKFDYTRMVVIKVKGS